LGVSKDKSSKKGLELVYEFKLRDDIFDIEKSADFFIKFVFARSILLNWARTASQRLYTL
jgi:hypothetical protein